MGGQADGSIIIDTELDNKGFAAGSSELQSAIKSLVNKINSLGPTFQKALSGNSSAIASFRASAASLEDTIASIKAKMDELGNTQYQTDSYANATSELQKTEAAFDRLIDKQDKMTAMGVSQESAQWRSLQYDIDACAAKIAELRAEKERLESTGGAFMMGSDTAQYAALESQLAAASSRLTEMQFGVNQADSSMGSLTSRAREFAGHIGSAARKAASGLVNGIKSAASHMLGLKRHGQSMQSQFSGLISGAKKFALSLLGARGVYALLRKAVSAYMQENQQLSNTLSSCWSGIGNILGPIITQIINLVAQAVAYVTAFLKLFGIVGKSTKKAIGGAAGAASKAAKELKRQLASFDDLNILNDNSSSGGGGGGGADIGSSLPDVTLPDWVKLIAEQLKSGDWAGAATTLADKLNEMVDSVDWAGVGEKAGYYIDGVLEFLATFIEEFDWFNLGAKLATGVNKIIETVDWGNLGTVMSGKFRIILLTAAGFLLNLDWEALAKGFSAFAISFFDGIRKAIAAVDWQQLGRDVAVFIRNVDWAGVGMALWGALKAAITAPFAFLTGFLRELIDAAWGAVTDWWYGVAYEDGKFVIGGLLSGIWEGMKNIGSWINENISRPFTERLKSLFGIASPSTVMAELGGFIIEGLLNGMTGAWGGITTFLGEALSSVKTSIGDAWSNAKEKTTQAWSKVKTTVSGAWEKIKSKTSDTCSSVKNTVSSKFSNVKTAVSDKLTAAKNAATSAWDKIKSTAANTGTNTASSVSKAFGDIKNHVRSRLQDAYKSVASNFGDMNSKVSSVNGAIKSTMSSTWDSIKSTLSSKLGTVKDSLSNTFKTLKTNATTWGKDICTNLANGIKNAMSKVTSAVTNLASKIKSLIHFTEPDEGPLSDFHTYMPDMLALMAKGIRKNEHKAISAVDSVASGISDRLQAVAGRVTFTAPVMAVSPVVPYSVQARAGTAEDIGMVIDASNDKLAAVITQVVTNAASAIVAAVRESGGASGVFDPSNLTQIVINDINRRTRMLGKSPLI